MPRLLEDGTNRLLEDGTDRYLENEYDIVDTETLGLADAGESIGQTDTDTLTLVDAGESLGDSLADSDNVVLTDAGESLADTATDADVLALADDASVLVPLTDAEVLALDDESSVTSTFSDADTIALADAGEHIDSTVGVTDTEALGLVENQAVNAGVATISDADTISLAEDAAIAATLTDAETLTLVDAGEQAGPTEFDVTIGGDDALDIVIVDSTTITATTPGGPPGPADVVVETDAGFSPITPADVFTYDTITDPIPTVTDVSPGVGPSTGGTSVVITGTGFVGVTGVDFGGFPADFTLVTVNSPTQITCVAPPGSGIVDVTVTNDGGTSPADPAHDRYTYAAPPPVPTVSSVSPNRGLTTGGATITLLGSGFTDTTSVAFGAVAADPTTINIISDGHLTVTAPASAVLGSVDVTVTNTTGTSLVTPADIYTYASQPPVLHIVSITLPDSTVITDFTNPVLVSGVIAVIWSGTDDNDTTLTNTWLERADHGPFIATGGPAGTDLYGCFFDTAVLGDGIHRIEAAAVDSDSNPGYSPAVTLNVNNGTTPGISGNRNPDFEHLVPIASVGDAVHTLLAPHVEKNPALEGAVDQLVSTLAARDVHLEDWLNRNTLRRVAPANQLGDGSDHSDTGWIDVSPLTTTVVQKANPRSKLMVHLAVNGIATDPGRFVDMGVRVQGPAGYDHDFLVVRKTVAGSGDPIAHIGVGSVAENVIAGAYLVTLRVRVENSAVTWTSSANDTISMQVIEAPTV